MLLNRTIKISRCLRFPGKYEPVVNSFPALYWTGITSGGGGGGVGGGCYFCIPHCHAHEKQETIVLQNVGGGGGDKVHYRQCHNGK